MSNNGLTRSRSDRIFGGVIGGIAKHYGWNPGGARIAYVLLSILSAAFPGILVYIVLWLLLPLEHSD